MLIRSERWLKSNLLLAGLLALASLGGCAHGARGKLNSAANVAAVDAAHLDQARRDYVRLRPGADGRVRLRAAIERSLLQAAPELVHANDFSGACELLSRVTELYTPREIDSVHLSDDAYPLATFIAARAGRSGDEGAALAAEYLLARRYPKSGHEEKFATIVDWSTSSRNSVGMRGREGVFDDNARFADLLAVWGRALEIAATTVSLEKFADLVIAQRDLQLQLAQDVAAGKERPIQREDGEAISPNDAKLRAEGFLEAMRKSEVPSQDVAFPYLTFGELDLALRRLKSFDDGAPGQASFVKRLTVAMTDRSEGADALSQLSGLYVPARIETVRGICANGLQRFANDVRFPLCLARVAAERDEDRDSAAWYEFALTLAPDNRELYDEALVRVGTFVAERLREPYPRSASELISAADKLLAERKARWPLIESPVSYGKLHMMLGMLALSEGNVDAAIARYEVAAAEGDGAAAESEVGSLLKGLGRYEDAKSHLRRAVELSRKADASSKNYEVAAVQVELGDVLSTLGDSLGATAEFEAALATWTEVVDELEGEPRAIAQVRRGVLFDRLGRHDEAVLAFRAALDDAPKVREIYASVLSHLVTASVVDLNFAEFTWKRSRLQAQLDPDWRVYFALWVEIIAARAGKPTSESIPSYLAKLSEGDAWWATLGKLGAGKTSIHEFEAKATTLGERTEAHFYAGAQLLIKRDISGARSKFEQTLTSNMVSFYEYQMAQRLLHLLPKP